MMRSLASSITLHTCGKEICPLYTPWKYGLVSSMIDFPIGVEKVGNCSTSTNWRVMSAARWRAASESTMTTGDFTVYNFLRRVATAVVSAPEFVVGARFNVDFAELALAGRWTMSLGTKIYTGSD